MQIFKFDRAYAAVAAEKLEHTCYLSYSDLAKAYHNAKKVPAKYKKDVQQRLSRIRLVLMESGVLTVVVNQECPRDLPEDSAEMELTEAMRYLPSARGRGYALVKVGVINHPLFKAKASQDAKRGGTTLKAFLRALLQAHNNHKIDLNGTEDLMVEFINQLGEPEEPERKFLRELADHRRSTLEIVSWERKTLPASKAAK